MTLLRVAEGFLLQVSASGARVAEGFQLWLLVSASGTHRGKRDVSPRVVSNDGYSDIATTP